MRVLLLQGSDGGGLAPTSLPWPGLVAVTASEPNEALSLAKRYDFDVFLIETSDLREQTVEVVSKVRARRISSPIMVIVAQSSTRLRIAALAAGVDDIVTRPVEGGEVAARMNALVRRHRGYDRALLQVGPVRLDLGGHNVTVFGRSIHVTSKEYALLELLMLRRGNILTKESVLAHLYSGIDTPDAKIIDVFISRLRHKLARAGAHHLIATSRGIGFTIRASSGVEPCTEPEPKQGRPTVDSFSRQRGTAEWRIYNQTLHFSKRCHPGHVHGTWCRS